MRIIGGNLKGRQIGLPRGTDIRPTTDMAREALFNIIEHRSNIEEMQVLDLFS
ncbi:MAG: RsmD family RNA methyltransferase, partial [Bacteroidales bacterium]|nr:RsmD family RNA methyltransferase [Bacteroidales bacterium]